MTLHFVAGDPSKDRRYTTESKAIGTPVAPDHVDPIARTMDSIVPLLSDMGVLGSADGKSLVLYCECYSRYRAGCAFVTEHGGYNDKGNQNGATKDIHVCQNQLRARLVEFCCTPTARAD